MMNNMAEKLERIESLAKKYSAERQRHLFRKGVKNRASRLEKMNQSPSRNVAVQDVRQATKLWGL